MKLEEIRKLIDGATPGPWIYGEDQPGLHSWVKPILDETQGDFSSEMTFADMRFIAAARTLMPALLEVVEKIQAVKVAQHGPIFWQCDCAPLENLDAALAALEALELP